MEFDAEPTQVRLNIGRRVAVFGSADNQPSEALLAAAKDLGSRLGTARYLTVSGASGPLGAALAEGVDAAGGALLLATAEGQPPPRGVRTLEARHADLMAKTRYLIETADAFVVLPGGMETLTQLATAWSQLRGQETEGPPLLVFDDPWKPILDRLSRSPGFWKPDVGLVAWVSTPEDVLSELREKVPVGRALDRFERNHPTFAEAVDRYFAATPYGCREVFAGLSPLVWKAASEALSLDRVLEAVGQVCRVPRHSLSEIQDAAWTETTALALDQWETEFLAPRHGLQEVSVRIRHGTSRAQGVRLAEVVTTSKKGAGDPRVGHVLRVHDLGRGWVIVFELGSPEARVAVAAAKPALAYDLLDAVEGLLAA